MATSPNPQGPDLSMLRIEERARKRGGLSKALGWFAALLGIALGAMGLFFTLRAQKPVVEVATARGAGQKVTALLNASGYVTPRRRATVAAKITGQVTSVMADEGVHVKAGQVLATLDDSDARRRFESAKAERDATAASIADLKVNLADAERELKRAQELQASGIQSMQALDRARTTVESLQARIALAGEQVRAAEARITVAQQDLDNCVVRAPFEGLVVSKDAQLGEMVSPITAGGGFTRTGIATLVDMQSLEIEVDVNESFIARVKAGQSVTATLDAYPNWAIPARVRTVIPTADRQKATVKVRVSFLKLDPRILPDMGVKVAFLEDQPALPRSGTVPRSGKTAAQALIPSEAVRRENGAPVVYLVRDGRLERRAVSLGRQHGTDVEVMAGLTEGDQVLLRGPQELRDGQLVTIKQ